MQKETEPKEAKDETFSSKHFSGHIQHTVTVKRDCDKAALTKKVNSKLGDALKRMPQTAKQAEERRERDDDAEATDDVAE
jgi:hypothetical protein